MISLPSSLYRSSAPCNSWCRHIAGAPRATWRAETVPCLSAAALVYRLIIAVLQDGDGVLDYLAQVRGTGVADLDDSV